MKPTHTYGNPSRKMSIEEYVCHVIRTIRSLFKEDTRFKEALVKEPNVDLKYLNGKIALVSVLFTCDGGHGALIARSNGISYTQEKNEQELVGYNDWSIFNN